MIRVRSERDTHSTERAFVNRKNSSSRIISKSRRKFVAAANLGKRYIVSTARRTGNKQVDGDAGLQCYFNYCSGS
jgi:hypothetical protein